MELKNHRVAIKKINNRDEITTSTQIIRDSFRTIALQFGLTRQNCPTHPSFMTVSQLIALKERGSTFFGLFLDDRQVGFLAVEKAENGLYYLEKLAIMPSFRHEGLGRMLVKQALDYIKGNDGHRVSIGLIDENTILKNWYRGIGFKEINTKIFPNLPFSVCFMELEIKSCTGDKK
jgi:diamine N-acetyltransferase